MLSKIIMRLIPVLLSFTLGSLGIVQAQKKVERKQETPYERFYRKGGKTTKAKVISKDRELTTEGIAQGRDLSLYDDGRHFSCHFIYEGDEPECSIPKVREFIWQHWREKRRGYIRITLGSIDYVATSHIFIEPNPNGVWHVAWRVVSDGKISDMPDILSMKRVKHGEFNREGGSYVLSFKDKDGDESQRL